MVLFFFQNSFSCINGETKLLKNGFYLFNDHGFEIPLGHSFFGDSKKYSKVKNQLDSLYKKTNDISYLSDIGVLLIIEKKYQEAIELYINIEKQFPNRYSTASNLGTIYELIGNDESALFWIEKSVKINPKSHYNSEWIHINILKAKIDNSLVNSKFLIGKDFGNELHPTSKLSKEELRKLRMALFYQLNERITFIKDKDKIIALLLFELGNIDFMLRNNSVIDIYNLSKKYGFENDIIDKRLIEYKSISKKSIFKNVQNSSFDNNLIYKYLNYLLIGLVTILVILILYKVFRKKEIK